MAWVYEIGMTGRGTASDTAELKALRASGAIADYTLVWSDQQPGKIYSYGELAKQWVVEEGETKGDSPFIPASELPARRRPGTPEREFFTPPPLHKWHLPD